MKSLIWILALAAIAVQAQDVSLFNGKDLTGWKVADFFEHGKVAVLPDGTVECGFGNPMTGIVYTNKPPAMNYELSIQAMRVQGMDFFCALTLPIETNCCTVIVGGWGGSLCGVSSVDYMDASENQWSEAVDLQNGRWYTLRVRVTPGVLQVFIDNDLFKARIEFEKSTRFSLRAGSDIDKTAPLGLATYRTRAYWRNFTLTPIHILEPGDKPRGDE